MDSSVPKYKIIPTIDEKHILRFSHQAMATVFEIFFVDEDENYVSQAANSAFNELDRLEHELSFFLENSDISRINNLLQNEIITIGSDAFDCLKQCFRLYQWTKGAFDITIRPLFKLLEESEYPKNQPGEDELSSVMSEIGLPWLQIIEDTHQVCLMNKSIQLELGGFGKGYAIDVLKLHLDDWEIKSGLIHSGHSTVLTVSNSPESMKWPLSISDPQNTDIILKRIDLMHGALSGSGLKKGQHIIDPRSGKPVSNKLAAWAFASEAGEADALSTAFMAMTSEEITDYCEKYPVSGLVIDNDSENTKHFYGKWAEEEIDL
jgi:thiamine biosynthesis lipoprotein